MEYNVCHFSKTNEVLKSFIKVTLSNSFSLMQSPPCNSLIDGVKSIEIGVPLTGLQATSSVGAIAPTSMTIGLTGLSMTSTVATNIILQYFNKQVPKDSTGYTSQTPKNTGGYTTKNPKNTTGYTRRVAN